MKSRRRGLGRSSPAKVAICLAEEGKRRILKSGLMPRKSPSGGSKSSQGRLRISGTSEAMTRNRRAPTGTAAVIFSQDEASQRSKSCFPRALWASASISGLQLLLEERAKAAGDLPHRLRIRQRKALVAGESGSVKLDMKEISAVGTLSRFLYG